MVTAELNATSASLKSPRERAEDALRRLEQMSADINAAWPAENRFHFEILDLPPALVVKMTIRTHATYFVFAAPAEESGKPTKLWHRFEPVEDYTGHDVLQSRLSLFPLHRGPSAHPRFLAAFDVSGCAGSLGVVYDGREWNAGGTGSIEQFIKQAGSFGLGEVPEFPQIGKLRTGGPLITLPYCWFSSIDTWDNPSLCAVDTYDASGDNVTFRSRSYNRPDLVPIAKAIEYAQQRDYPAVLGYCASSQIAHKLVRDLPPFVFAGQIRVRRTGSGKEHVELGWEPDYRFDVEELDGRWRVVSFSAQ
jgi:hypothetical protein